MTNHDIRMTKEGLIPNDEVWDAGFVIVSSLCA